MRWYRELEKYTRENGNPHVPSKHSNTKLASWVWTQRLRRDDDYQSAKQLTPKQVALLDKLGFHWDARDGKWLAQFEMLKKFKSEFNHCNVELERGGHAKLFIWLTKQRTDKREGRLQAERETMLNELGVEWDGASVLEAKWREMYEQLKQFHSESGHSDVPDRYKVNLPLSSWVQRQRDQKKTMRLRMNKSGCWTRLDLLGNIVTAEHGKEPLPNWLHLRLNTVISIYRPPTSQSFINL